ncbi:hypothetical protein [Dictyobacter vulcani]|uniref:hypothetical protein n=1 Tax=Dictyobacter vulcani TaxID=2607529 RepID=UPI001386EA6E|nr:hypothetical protein [Dictyobacter vulcani]
MRFRSAEQRLSLAELLATPASSCWMKATSTWTWSQSKWWRRLEHCLAPDFIAHV